MLEQMPNYFGMKITQNYTINEQKHINCVCPRNLGFYINIFIFRMAKY